VEQIIQDVARRKSPITGEGFDPLSVPYKKDKQSDNLPGIPNLERSGEMLNQLDFKLTPDGIEIGIFGDAAPRADGHNNLSGESSLPTRQFLPNEGESFRPGISEQVDKILAESVAENTILPDALPDIESSSELYDFLQAITGFESRAQIRSAVLRNAALYNELAEAELIEFL